MLAEYDISYEKLSFIPSSLPIFRLTGPSGGYLLKFSRDLKPEAGENAPHFHPPGTDNRLQLLWMEALARDTDLLLQQPVRNGAGKLITPSASCTASSRPPTLWTVRWRPNGYPK